MKIIFLEAKVQGFFFKAFECLKKSKIESKGIIHKILHGKIKERKKAGWQKKKKKDSEKCAKQCKWGCGDAHRDKKLFKHKIAYYI